MTVYRATMGKAIMEAVGTAILMFTIQVSVGLNADLAPLAIGAVLVSIVFAGGPVSGAHYNPAVSLAVTLRGDGYMAPQMMGVYWGAQIFGGILGGILGGIVDSKFSVVEFGGGFTALQALTAEIVFAFVLCFVVLGVATNPKAADNHYYGLAIGFVVMAGAASVGPISGGAFNPAVALGLSISKGFSNFHYVLAVCVANLLGGILAAGVYSVVAFEEYEDIPATPAETLPVNTD